MPAPLVLWFSLILFFNRPVPINQVRAFLAQDQTDRNQYGNGYYCSDFAVDLAHNANLRGISAYPVAILFTHQIGHVIVVFETADAGMVYVEPQTDDIYSNVLVGQELCTADRNLCMGRGETIRKMFAIQPDK